MPSTTTREHPTSLRDRLFEVRLPEPPLRLRQANTGLILLAAAICVVVMAHVFLLAEVPNRLHDLAINLLILGAISNAILFGIDWQRAQYRRRHPRP